MLIHPTVDKLHRLGLAVMARSLAEQDASAELAALSFAERLGLLADRELTERDNRQLKNRLRKAALRQGACPEDIDHRHARGLDKALVRQLATCQWLRERHNVLISGPTGVGKTFIACALAHQACREGYSALYLRLPKLLPELALARGDGRHGRWMKTLNRTDLVVLDDYGLAAMTDEHRRDLLEILEERYERRSTMVTSQFPIEQWYGLIGDPTLADAILDRLVHNAYRLTLKGESLRKQRRKLTTAEEPNT